MRRILLIFLDGVGVGADADYNPFTRASLPVLNGLMHGGTNSPATLCPLDATLGVVGTPQSGTGQTTLLTGTNAAALNGRHFGPWVPTALRPLVRDQSILARASRAGRRVAFANAYPEQAIRVMDAPPEGVRLPSFLRAAPPIAAAGAGVFTRNVEDLKAGHAVSSEIVNDGWRTHLGYTGLPEISPRAAGAVLARIAAQHDLTLFAHYATDGAGHSRSMDEGVAALERVDAFMDGVIEALPGDVLTIIASDHGNIEDIRGGHTRNPALGLVIGDDHARIAAGAHSLLDVAPMILQQLEV